MSLFAAALAAIVAFAANRLALMATRQGVVVKYLAPVAEEAAKSGLAVLFGTPILPVHVLFGLAEAVFDIAKPGRRGMAAAVASLTGHTLYGALTVQAGAAMRSLLWGVTVAAIVHVTWNSFVWENLARRARGGGHR